MNFSDGEFNIDIMLLIYRNLINCKAQRNIILESMQFIILLFPCIYLYIKNIKHIIYVVIYKAQLI